MAATSTGGAILAWAASTAYAQGQAVTYNGQTYIANAAFTSGATFNAANWTLLPTGTVPVTLDQVMARGTRHHAHRGAGRWIHENTIESLQLAAALGHDTPDGGDFQFSSDGKGVSNHNGTIVSGDLTGPGSLAYAGSINAVTARGFKAMKVGSANYSYRGIGPAASSTSGIFTNVPDGTPYTMEDAAQFFAVRPGLIWLPEIKDSRCAAELLALIVRYGLQTRTLVASFTLPDLAIFVAAGIQVAWLRTTTSGYSLALAQAAGVTFLGYSYADATWQAGAGVTLLQAASDAGIKLWPFTFTRRSQIDAEPVRISRPIAVATSDYGIYTSRAFKPQLTDPYKEGVPFAGQIPSSSNPGSFYRASSGKFSIVGASRVLQGWACADVTDWATGTAYVERDIVQQDTGLWVCNTAHTSGATFAADSAKWTVYKITLTTTFEVVGAAGSTGIVVAFGCADDSDVTGGTTIATGGFVLTIKKDGTSAIVRWNGGVSRQTISGPTNGGAGTARVDGAVEQWTIEYLTGANAGKIKVSNVTASTSATMTDNATGGTTAKRGYITFGTTASDLDVSFSGVALT